MSIHTEWVDAHSAHVALAEPGELEDSYGQANERYALSLSGDDCVLIEGSIHDLRQLARRISSLVDNVDDSSSASRQHFIDTGRYLTHR